MVSFHWFLSPARDIWDESLEDKKKKKKATRLDLAAAAGLLIKELWNLESSPDFLSDTADSAWHCG